jgi:crossover junction endodeoxyribonuclease RuvC
VRVLGVDPGTMITGWGVVDADGRVLRHVASGTIRAGRGDLSRRLGFIYEQLCAIAAEHGPEYASLERNFLARNVQSAFRLGEARGVVMAAASISSMPLAEYTPATVKKAVTGNGGADKSEVQRAVRRIFAVSHRLATDEADALAVAACHVFKSRFASRLSAATRRVSAPSGARLRVGPRVLG